MNDTFNPEQSGDECDEKQWIHGASQAVLLIVRESGEDIL